MGGILRRGLLSATAFAALALSPASAAAGGINERFAEPGGDGDPNLCTAGDPCDIQAAVESGTVDPGDTVTLLPGTYALGADELTMSEGTILRGQPGQARPLLTSNSANGLVVAGGAGAATIRRIEMSHTGTDNGILLSSSTAMAEQVISASSGLFACAGRVLWRDSVCVLNSPSTGTGAAGSSCGACTGTVTLRNVTAISRVNGKPGVALLAVAGGILTVDARNVIADGTTVDALPVTDSGSSATITLASSNYDTVSMMGPGASVTAAGLPNQTALPLFVNAAGNDFHQAPNSPTINAGAPDAMLGTVDLDGDPRTLGGVPDIGADEFVPPVSTVNPTPGAIQPKKKCKKKKKKKTRASAAAKKRCKKKKKK